MNKSKPRIVKDYEKISDEILEQIKLKYPRGFHRSLISYVDKEGKQRSALTFETEDVYYLVRMTLIEAKQIIKADDDYDDDGLLKEDIQEEYEDKHSDEDEIDIEEIPQPEDLDD
jgi:hypothetical protein